MECYASNWNIAKLMGQGGKIKPKAILHATVLDLSFTSPFNVFALKLYGRLRPN